MPNLWAHVIFGEQVLSRTGQSSLIKRSERRQLYNLGCQGPDFLLYHNFYPWKRDARVSDLGGLIHTKRCGPFLMEMIKHIASCKEDDPLVVYTLGFITHYVLDRHVHPYVYARSGYEQWQHQRFEVMMDTIIADELKGIATWKDYAWKQIDVGKQLPQAIVNMFDEVTSAVFPEEHAGLRKEDWNEAYRHMVQAHRLFRDPYGIKRVLLLKQTDPFIYKRKLPNVDIMNLSKNTWVHPTNEAEMSTASVWELWEQALDNAARIASLLITALDGEAEHMPYEEIAATVGDYSYDSGKPSFEDLPLKYAAPII